MRDKDKVFVLYMLLRQGKKKRYVVPTLKKLRLVMIFLPFLLTLIGIIGKLPKKNNNNYII